MKWLLPLLFAVSLAAVVHAQTVIYATTFGASVYKLPANPRKQLD